MMIIKNDKLESENINNKNEIIDNNHVDDKKTKKGKKKKKGNKILKFVINYIVPIISVISSCFIVREIHIMTDQLQLERNNQSFVLNEITLEYVKGDRYKVLFDKQQGGIKKAYIADIREEGIVYNLLSQSLEDCEIELFPVDTEKIKQYQDNSNIDVSGLKFEDIRQFALVVLDTTDQWNVHYFVVRPEIDGSKYEYKFEVAKDDGQTIAGYKEELKKDEMQCASFDTQLINELTISEKIAILSEKYEYYFFSEAIKLKGKNGEIITSNPYMEIHYTVPTVQEIHDNIVEIYTDINPAM